MEEEEIKELQKNKSTEKKRCEEESERKSARGKKISNERKK